jgi:collagenase-like PrtC family protease
MVKIMSPVTSFEGSVEVISAGADEVYCGILPKETSGRTISGSTGCCYSAS